MTRLVLALVLALASVSASSAPIPIPPQPQAIPADGRPPVKAGDIVFIEQDPAMGVIMARNSIARIDELPGKYHVKTLSVGTILKTDM